MNEKEFRKTYGVLCERTIEVFLNEGHLSEIIMGVDGNGKIHIIGIAHSNRDTIVEGMRKLFKLLRPTMYVHVTETKMRAHTPGATMEADAITVLGVSREQILLRTYEILRRGQGIKPDAIFRDELSPIPGDGDDPMMKLMDDLEEPNGK